MKRLSVKRYLKNIGLNRPSRFRHGDIVVTKYGRGKVVKKILFDNIYLVWLYSVPDSLETVPKTDGCVYVSGFEMKPTD